MGRLHWMVSDWSVVITLCYWRHHSLLLTSSLSATVVIILGYCRHHSLLPTSSLSATVVITLCDCRHHSLLLSSSLSATVVITLCWRHHSLLLSSSLSATDDSTSLCNTSQQWLRTYLTPHSATNPTNHWKKKEKLLPALVRDLLTFTSEVIKSFIIQSNPVIQR
jgi:hypothetical protein